jgi:uncharacterized protein YicC (UPF0701 family)
MARAKARKRQSMSAAHKAALAKGREEGRAVRSYLEAIESQRPRRGRKRTPESVRRRLASVKRDLANADALTRLHLMQERTDLEAELDRITTSNEIASKERAFVKVARSYGRRKGIGYSAWRAAGVSPAVLQRASIGRAERGAGG